MRSHVGARAWDEAVRSLDLDPTPRTRPPVFRWLWYALWGPLPERYRTWVLYDATCPTWVLRHVARLLTIAVLPVVAVVALLPGALGLRLLTALVAGLGGFLFAVLWVNEATDYRVARAGWPVGIASELRTRRAELARWMASLRRL